MTDRVTWRVDGLKELESALKELGSDVAGKNGGLVRTALMNAALPVWRESQRLALASVDTGALQDAITRRRIKDPDIGTSEQVDVGLFSTGKGKKVWYGKFVEFGTRLHRAQPFLRPALEGNRSVAVNNFRRNLATGIERVAKRIGNENARKVGARIKKL